MDQRDRITTMLMECLREHAEQAGIELKVAENTPLMGPGAALDSLGLVQVVNDFEARLNQAFDAQVVLAGERAMSTSHSPFRSVDALADYAGSLLAESGKR